MKNIGALAISVILMVTLTGCGIRFEIRGNGGTNVKTYETMDIENQILYEDEENINIDLKYGDITISSYDGNNVAITGSTNLGSDTIKLDKNNNSIVIKDISSDDFLNNIFGSDVKMNLDIKIPNGFQGNIDLDYGAGLITLDGITCKELRIDGGAGKLIIDDIVFDKLYLNAGVGQTNINLLKKCGDIDIDGGVGEIKISLTEVGGDLIVDGGVGKTEIKIPENSPVYFDTESGIGNSSINATTSGDKTYKFKLSIGIGEMKVYN